MVRGRNSRFVAVVAIIIAIVGLSIAYAAMSTTLKIKGNATIDIASWDIKFDNLGTTIKTGNAVCQDPTLSNTNIRDYSVVLTKPGDSCSYQFDIVNNGTIDATLGALSKNDELMCKAIISDSSSQFPCANITYSLTYDSVNGTNVSQGDSLAAGTKKTVYLTLAYNSDATELASNDLLISGLDITLIYNQS